ncbi:MAG TPA: pyrroline-5-carboxylate reductase [Dehalococcoidales bacterium]|nr:pyrroline-5-carboxylate reductase [Dehalococcoidales bacterium]
MKIACIGGGNMGEAVIAALISKNIVSARDVIVSDISEARRRFLVEKYKVIATGDNAATLPDRDAFILAVKPQVFPEVAATLNGKLTAGQFVISIMAGIKLDTLKELLGYTAVIRAMPNTPAQIGEGVTVWTATAAVTSAQKKRAEAILGATGKEIYVDEEKNIDMATAVSGSGPAYLFYFVEAFTEAAVKIGWTPEVAKELALGTVFGAADLLKKSNTEAAELRRMVTSPGGTTAAAISKMESGKFKELMADAVRAALNRAIELGKPAPSQKA